MAVALSETGPFSVDKHTLTTSTATNRVFTLTNAKFDPNLPETVEVLVTKSAGGDAIKLKGDGTSITAGSGDEFYVNSATDPSTLTIEANSVLNSVTDSTITSLGSGDLVVIKRISNRTTKNVDYAPGSVIREIDLDNSNTQILHVAQEAVDIASSSMILGADDKFDGKSKVIKDVEDGSADNDAVNKGQLDTHNTTITGYMQNAEDYKNTAISYATRNTGFAQTYSSDSASDTSDHSAKAWAVGGTGVTQTTDKGAAKQWAIGTGRIDDQSSGGYSAKEHATGTTVAEGSSKEWATNAGSAEVATSAGYSSKAYAQDTSASADTTGGSAKGWASTAYDTAVPGAASTARSALHYSTDASNSAIAAANSASAVGQVYDNFSDVYLGSMADSGSQGTNPTTNGTWAKDSSSITVVSATNIKVGQVVTGTGIPTSPKPNVLSIDGTTVVISDAMAAAGSAVALTFTGYGVYGDYNTSKDGPALNNDGDALVSGNLFFNSTDNEMRIYDGANWIAATSAGSTSLLEYKFVTTSGQVSSKTYSGTADVGGTLSYTQDNIIVFMNGVQLKATTDYTATNGTSIVLVNAPVLNDEIAVIAFKSFTTADMVSKTNGGTFAGAVTFSAGLVANTVDINGGTIDGATITGNITGNASGTAATVTGAAQSAITSVGTLTAVTVTGAITANGGLETDTNSKVKQKGSAFQSHITASLALGY